MCAWNRMAIGTTDVQMPMRGRFVTVQMGMTVHATGADAPESNSAKCDEQYPPEHLAAPFDNDGKRPTEQDDGAGADREQQRMTNGKANGDAQRARAFYCRRFCSRANRQRGDGHQVIGAQAMQEPER